MTSDSDSGIISLLLCFAALVFSGVFLAIMADKRAAGTSEKNSKLSAIHRNQEEIKKLRETIEITSCKLESKSVRLRQQRHSLAAANIHRNSLNAEIRDLRLKRIRRELEKKTLEDEYERYVLSYRNILWHRSKGKRINYILLKSGRKLDNVIVLDVSQEGMVVSHNNGIARLPVADLSLTIRERFQLHAPVPTTSD